MTETIQTAMDRLMTISVGPQDYVAEDGLLYCGSCKTPKEAFFPNGIKLFGRDRHPAECRCRQATREKQKTVKKNRCCMVCWLPCSSGFCWDYSVEFLERQTGSCQRELFQYSTVLPFTS